MVSTETPSTVSSNIVHFGDVLDLAKMWLMAWRAKLTRPPTSTLVGDYSETNDTNGKTSPQWTNDCELERRFDYLIAAGTILSEYRPFN